MPGLPGAALRQLPQLPDHHRQPSNDHPSRLQRPTTTIYINPEGKVVYIHTGQYESLGTFDQDLSTYILGS
jgi:hypothetical protein